MALPMHDPWSFLPERNNVVHDNIFAVHGVVRVSQQTTRTSRMDGLEAYIGNDLCWEGGMVSKMTGAQRKLYSSRNPDLEAAEDARSKVRARLYEEEYVTAYSRRNFRL
ncbi:hypothetical protein BST61_g3911 [Cercospora zeina]